MCKIRAHDDGRLSLVSALPGRPRSRARHAPLGHFGTVEDTSRATIVKSLGPTQWTRDSRSRDCTRSSSHKMSQTLLGTVLTSTSRGQSCVVSCHPSNNSRKTLY